ncbi:hypothetical protein J6P92_08950 [bacterium]|nr:hypothetical protein [bacterium]
MRNIVIILFIFILLAIAGSNNTNKNKISKTSKPTSAKQIKITGLDGLGFSFKNIPNSIDNYLKTESEIKDYYNADKKIVLYFRSEWPGFTLPEKELESAVRPYMTNNLYRDSYNFYNFPVKQITGTREIIEASNEFINSCNIFCIVNPKTKQLFSADRISSKQIEKIGSVIEQLKDW